MPSLDIAWSHQLMRLMLKYKEVVGLGDAAQDLLDFAKRTKALDQRLHDHERGAAVLVTLDEPLVRGESERLLRALSDRRLRVTGIIWNRADASTPPLPTEASVPQLFAPVSSPAPVDGDWVAERAVAHDRVLTWASDRGAVIPLPMFTALFRSAQGIDDMLRTRGPTLRSGLAQLGRGREYALRVYRVDAELKAALPSLDPAIASLAAAARAASPGQRYLLERKLDERIKDDLRATSQRIAAEILDQLAAVAVDSVLSPIPRVTAQAPGTMVLNASFLVPPKGLLGFQEKLTEIVS